MEDLLSLWLLSIVFLAPVLYLLFYAHEIFGLPKSLILIYLLGLVIGFFFWKPLVLITLVITWSLMIISWLILLWQLFTK